MPERIVQYTFEPVQAGTHLALIFVKVSMLYCNNWIGNIKASLCLDYLKSGQRKQHPYLRRLLQHPNCEYFEQMDILIFLLQLRHYCIMCIGSTMSPLSSPSSNKKNDITGEYRRMTNELPPKPPPRAIRSLSKALFRRPNGEILGLRLLFNLTSHQFRPRNVTAMSTFLE